MEGVQKHNRVRACGLEQIVLDDAIVALAQEAEMSLSEYENFVYSACLQDWKKLSGQLEKIARTFEKGNKVHLIGRNVDLKFSISGKNALADCGEENMPGGEVYMAPVRESLEGWIHFEYPSIRNGKEITDIRLWFKEGKVVVSTTEGDVEINAGDIVVFPSGLSCKWKVLETIRKVYKFG